MRAFAILLCLTGVAGAGKLDEIRARGKLIVSVKNQGPASPDLHKDPAHFQKRGFELELAHAIAGKILGDPGKLELQLMPRKTRLAAVMGDNVDLAISMLPIAPDPEAVVFSRPYFASGLGIMVKTGSPIAKLEELDGKKLAAVQQTANDPEPAWRKVTAARKIRTQIVRFPSFASAAQAVADGKADALLSHDVNIDAFLDGNAGFRRLAEIVAKEPIGVAVKKGNDDLLALVNEVIDGLERAGTLAAWAKKHKLPYRL
jgi:putative glutamine transport system substrate-binding protein